MQYFYRGWVPWFDRIKKWLYGINGVRKRFVGFARINKSFKSFYGVVIFLSRKMRPGAHFLFLGVKMSLAASHPFGVQAADRGEKELWIFCPHGGKISTKNLVKVVPFRRARSLTSNQASLCWRAYGNLPDGMLFGKRAAPGKPW